MNPCGFCGRDICQTSLEETSKKKGEKHYKIKKTNCPYSNILLRKPTKANRVNPCTNYLEKCNACGADVWKYNQKKHYELVHQEMEDVPQLDEHEIDLVKKLKY